MCRVPAEQSARVPGRQLRAAMSAVSGLLSLVSLQLLASRRSGARRQWRQSWFSAVDVCSPAKSSPSPHRVRMRAACLAARRPTSTTESKVDGSRSSRSNGIRRTHRGSRHLARHTNSSGSLVLLRRSSPPLNRGVTESHARYSAGSPENGRAAPSVTLTARLTVRRCPRGTEPTFLGMASTSSPGTPTCG